MVKEEEPKMLLSREAAAAKFGHAQLQRSGGAPTSQRVVGKKRKSRELLAPPRGELLLCCGAPPRYKRC